MNMSLLELDFFFSSQQFGAAVIATAIHRYSGRLVRLPDRTPAAIDLLSATFLSMQLCCRHTNSRNGFQPVRYASVLQARKAMCLISLINVTK